MSESDDFRDSADRSDARCKRLGIDPPRPGRKTYDDRYAETNSQSVSELRALRARRVEQGKEVGVIDRVLSNKLS